MELYISLQQKSRNMNTLSKWLAVIIAVLGILLVMAFRQGDMMEKKYNTAVANMKSYDVELSVQKEKNVAYQFTIDQLGYFQDSVLRELDATRKELKIKDGKLKSLQAVSSTFTRTDTITLKDTIFREPSFALDTTIRDNWSKVELTLRYPSTIAVTPEFRSEKHIIVSTKKETVNPPKKCWLLRLFQKKHTILRVDVVEKNPYVVQEESKYIEILK